MLAQFCVPLGIFLAAAYFGIVAAGIKQQYIWGIGGFMAGWGLNVLTDNGMFLPTLSLSCLCYLPKFLAACCTAACLRKFSGCLCCGRCCCCTAKTRLADRNSGGYVELDHTILNTVSESAWINLGFWKRQHSYSEACSALARMIANYAKLGPQDRVLDVGFGRGEEILFWQKEFGVKHISGVNLSQAEVSFARAYIARKAPTDISATVDLRTASACDIHPSMWKLKESGLFFDKVISVDSAYHYAPSRFEFFSRAKSVLAPGGCISLGDIVLQKVPGGRLEKALISLICSASGIPRGNLITVDAYVAELKRAGFVEVRVREQIGKHVFPGFSKFMRRHNAQFGSIMRWGMLLRYRIAGALLEWAQAYLDFIVVTAIKPGAVRIRTSPDSLDTDSSTLGMTPRSDSRLLKTI
eukprot:g103.t1